MSDHVSATCSCWVSWAGKVLQTLPLQCDTADPNLDLLFALTSCFTKVKEPSLSYYLPIAGKFDSYFSEGYLRDAKVKERVGKRKCEERQRE